jgi:hypothetical protein
LFHSQPPSRLGEALQLAYRLSDLFFLELFGYWRRGYGE